MLLKLKPALSLHFDGRLFRQKYAVYIRREVGDRALAGRDIVERRRCAEITVGQPAQEEGFIIEIALFCENRPEDPWVEAIVTIALAVPAIY